MIPTKPGVCDNCSIFDDNLSPHWACGLWFCIGCFDKMYDECPHCSYLTPKEWSER